jgi:DNA helicase-2/ATP-dependent DNA helicase PcrA
MLEEERRLCYVGMTRAERRLFLSWARYRRRFGGGQPEASIPSRFLKEVPAHLVKRARGVSGLDSRQVDLLAEQYVVRESVKKNLYTGKTYNSVEHIRQFFSEKGMPAPQGLSPQAPKASPAAAGQPPAYPPQQPKAAPTAPPARPKKKFGAGSTVQHPKYGRGTVLRREGEGDDAKLTISFPGHGLKKIVERFAGIKIDE